jgi:hypothetical protein
MRYRLVAVAMLVGACGTVAGKSTDAGVGEIGGPDAAAGPVTWRNQPADLPGVMFGGTAANGVTYCKYTITLKQLDVQLTIAPSGQVTSGHVQDLNLEAAIQPCSNDPIAPNIATYELATATATTGGTTLTFQGGATNMPPATLTVMLAKVNSLYTANLTFHRNDGLDPVFEWMVTTMPPVPLAPQ